MSLLPTPYEFEQEYDDDERLADELPDRSITSLRDLQYLYGRLYTLATAGGGEYASYLTPEKSTDLFDEPESLAILRIDLSGDEPRLDPEQPVRFRTYTRDLVEPVAHSWYNAAKGFDHSVTHRTGKGKEPEKVAEYLTERLTAWAADDVIREAVADHEDGWIVEALAELGKREGIGERIEEAVTERLEGSTTALTTVAVRFEANEEYQLPGACGSDVFNVAMRARKRSKLVSKGEATESAGEATDLVTENRGRTVGTAEDPLNYFLGKQLEKFPGFDPDEAWRTHPVSEDVAVTLMNASTFVDACSYYTLEANVYYLPYFFGRITPEEARELYRMLHDAVEQDDLTPVEKVYTAYNRHEINEKLATRMRFYVAAVLKHQTKRFDVFGDTLDCTLFHPVGLASAHNAVTNSWVFDAEATLPHPDVRPAMPIHENWEMLVADEEYFLGSITNGWYFRTTFAEPDDDQTASADDFRIRALVAALSGGSIPVSTLLEEYVERLLDDEGEDFPAFRVATQYAQFCALAKAGLLTGEDESLTKPTTYTDQSMTHTTDTQARTDDGSDREKREAKLEQFLEETPALSPDNPERRGGFLLGVLVGQVTGYQQVSEGRSTTLVDQYPIKAITDTKVKRLTSDVLDKNVIYSRENGLPSTMYGEVVDRIVKTLPKIDADDDWSIDTSDLRYYYALGVAYGMNNWTTDDEPSEEDVTTEPTEATHD